MVPISRFVWPGGGSLGAQAGRHRLYCPAAGTKRRQQADIARINGINGRRGSSGTHYLAKFRGSDTRKAAGAKIVDNKGVYEGASPLLHGSGEEWGISSSAKNSDCSSAAS